MTLLQYFFVPGIDYPELWKEPPYILRVNGKMEPIGWPSKWTWVDSSQEAP